MLQQRLRDQVVGYAQADRSSGGARQAPWQLFGGLQDEGVRAWRSQLQVMLVVEGIMRAPVRCRQGDWGSFDGGASSPISTGSPFCQTTAY